MQEQEGYGYDAPRSNIRAQPISDFLPPRFQPVEYGEYFLQDRIGSGGMAEIFLATARGIEGFEKRLVIKRILPTLNDDEQFVRMFIEEAKLCVALKHPNIVQVYDLGQINEQYFIAMEYVDGRDLLKTLAACGKKRIGFPTDIALYIVMETLKGLHHAHRLTRSDGQSYGIIHRDVSPSNLLLSFEGAVKIGDFGIAKASTREKTAAGILKGKFGYMAPEQVTGTVIDHRADVFAAGIVLFELLTGHRLFAGKNDLAVLERVRDAIVDPPPRHYRPDLDSTLEAIALKALSQKPEDRFQTAGDFHDALHEYVYQSGAQVGPAHLARFMQGLFLNDPEEKARRARVKLPPVEPPSPQALQRKNTRLPSAQTEAGELNRLVGRLSEPRAHSNLPTTPKSARESPQGYSPAEIVERAHSMSSTRQELRQASSVLESRSLGLPRKDTISEQNPANDTIQHEAIVENTIIESPPNLGFTLSFPDVQTNSQPKRKKRLDSSHPTDLLLKPQSSNRQNETSRASLDVVEAQTIDGSYGDDDFTTIGHMHDDQASEDSLSEILEPVVAPVAPVDGNITIEEFVIGDGTGDVPDWATLVEAEQDWSRNSGNLLGIETPNQEITSFGRLVSDVSATVTKEPPLALKPEHLELENSTVDASVSKYFGGFTELGPEQSIPPDNDEVSDELEHVETRLGMLTSHTPSDLRRRHRESSFVNPKLEYGAALQGPAGAMPVDTFGLEETSKAAPRATSQFLVSQSFELSPPDVPVPSSEPIRSRPPRQATPLPRSSGPQSALRRVVERMRPVKERHQHRTSAPERSSIRSPKRGHKNPLLRAPTAPIDKSFDRQQRLIVGTLVFAIPIFLAALWRLSSQPEEVVFEPPSNVAKSTQHSGLSAHSALGPTRKLAKPSSAPPRSLGSQSIPQKDVGHHPYAQASLSPQPHPPQAVMRSTPQPKVDHLSSTLAIPTQKAEVSDSKEDSTFDHTEPPPLEITPPPKPKRETKTTKPTKSLSSLRRTNSVTTKRSPSPQKRASTRGSKPRRKKHRSKVRAERNGGNGFLVLRCREPVELHIRGLDWISVPSGTFKKALPPNGYVITLIRAGQVVDRRAFRLLAGITLEIPCS